MLKRHAIQVLREAGHSQTDVARRLGVSERSVRTVEGEAPVATIDDTAERKRRRIGRPSKAEPLRPFVAELMAKEPELLSLEVLRRARLQAGYAGGKSALYALVASLRPTLARPVVRFEGLPGEFTQHDFGHVDVRIVDGRRCCLSGSFVTGCSGSPATSAQGDPTVVRARASREVVA